MATSNIGNTAGTVANQVQNSNSIYNALLNGMNQISNTDVEQALDFGQLSSGNQGRMLGLNTMYGMQALIEKLIMAPITAMNKSADRMLQAAGL
jgi:hypothetical protein